MTGFDAENLRCDAFLGGRVQLWQPVKGYRAGVDPVLLAASVPAKSGQTVLDLGCGAGAAALCLGARVQNLRLFGLEKLAAYAELARRNGAQSNFEVFEGDVAEPPKALRTLSFDHVISNPPYYNRTRGSSAPDLHRESALGEDVPLVKWIRTGAKRLKPRGYFHMIIKAERLGDAVTGLQNCLGSLEILPLAPREGRDAELVILRARKEGRASLRLHAPVILHRGRDHPGDKDHYTPQISDVLRCSESLEF